ncbi:MAG: sulfotransferase family protein [Longimicrobiales bacterium]|jgi:hypothetical protein|nr:sulfotransferase family protein [Longimicrobiales bacterium]
MFLSPRHKILFVHIAKTGGTSVRSALQRLHWTDPYAIPIHLVNGLTRILKYKTGAKFPRHAKAIAAFECIGEPFWSQLFKFTFVRNPWDLQVSNWHYLGRHPKAPLSGLRDFEEFLRYMFREDRPWDYHIDTHRIIQSHYVTDHSGKVILDFIGRFERLHEDFEEVCRLGRTPQVSLPHKRRSVGRKKDYRSYYDDVTAGLIAEHYAQDIDLFGYSFDDFDREMGAVGPLSLSPAPETSR